MHLTEPKADRPLQCLYFFQNRTNIGSSETTNFGFIVNSSQMSLRHNEVAVRYASFEFGQVRSPDQFAN